MAADTDEVEVIHRHHMTQIIRRIAWLHFKLSLGTWAVVFLIIPPTATQSAVNSTIWLIVCICGAIISAVGLTLGFWPKRRRISVVIELAGLLMMIVGPLVYFTTQISIIQEGSETEFQGRFALTFFAYAMIAAVIARLATVFPRFRISNRRFHLLEK